MTEKRKDPRRQLVDHPPVTDEETGQPIGRLGNISREGMLLLTSVSTERWRTYRLRVKPPEGLAAVEAPVVSAQCVWSRPGGDPCSGLAGFKFAATDEKTRTFVGVIMRDFGFPDGHRPDDAAEDEAP